jgi:hypothetical protein
MFYFTVWPLPIVDDHFFIKIFIYFKICSKIYFILIKNIIVIIIYGIVQRIWSAETTYRA